MNSRWREQRDIELHPLVSIMEDLKTTGETSASHSQISKTFGKISFCNSLLTEEELRVLARAVSCQAIETALNRVTFLSSPYNTTIDKPMDTCKMVGANLARNAVRNAQTIIKTEMKLNDKHLQQIAGLKSQHHSLLEVMRQSCERKLNNEVDKQQDAIKKLVMENELRTQQLTIKHEETLCQKEQQLSAEYNLLKHKTTLSEAQLKEEKSAILKQLELEQTKATILNNDNDQLIKENQLIIQRFDYTYMMSDQKHVQDTNTLNLLREQIHELRQERDGLQIALDSFKQSISSLIPLVSTTAQPSNITTPYISRPIMTIGSADSGMSSQQPSASRFNEGVWSSIPCAIGGDEELISHAGLSISQISEDDLPGAGRDQGIPRSIGNEKMAPELSIVRIDQSDSSIVIPPIIPANVVSEIHVIEGMVDHLHHSIDCLLRNYATVSAQADQFESKLSNNVSSGQFGAVERSRQIEHLQHKVKSLELQVPTGNNSDLSNELEQANDNISSLIQQVEDMRLKNDEQDKTTVNEVLVLKQKLMSSGNEMTAQRKLYKELREKRDQIDMDKRRKFEAVQKENKKLEKELSETRKRVIECKTLSEQLREKEEKENELRDELSQACDKLLAGQHHIARLESRDSTESVLLDKQLLSERRINEQLQQHLNKAVSSFETNSEQFAKQETVLKKELSELKGILTSKESLIQLIHTEKEKVNGQCAELSDQVTTLTQQINALHDGLKTSNDKVSQLCSLLEEKQQLIDSLDNEQTTLNENISLLQTESKRHLSAYEKSIIELQSLQDEMQITKASLYEKEREMEEMAVSKGELIQRLSDLETQLAESEECNSLKLLELQSTISKMKSELSEKVKETCLLKEAHVDELGQMEAKLLAEHRGHVALLRLQYSKQTDEVDVDILEKIQVLTPVLERSSNEVKALCKKIDVNKLKSLLNEREKELSCLKVSLEEMATNTSKLSADNNGLVLELANTNEIVLSSEHSMERANTIIDELKEQLEQLIAEKDQLNQQCFKEREIMEQRINQLSADCKEKKELLDSKQEDNDARETLLKCLEGERAAVAKLTDTLQNKESHLTNAVDQYLQEKVTTHKLKNEIDSLCSQIQQQQQQQQQQVMKLQSNIAALTTERLQNSKQAEKDSHKVLSTDSKFAHRARRAERRCKALVFQKKYLLSEIDAFYHTHHGALIMINDMGGARNRVVHKRPSFKTLGILILAVVRIKKLTIRHKKSISIVSTPPQLLLPSRRYSDGRVTIIMSKNSPTKSRTRNL